MKYIRLLLIGFTFASSASLVSAQSWTQNGTTGNYYWSNLNSNLGIGLNAPTAPFHIRRDFGTATAGEKNWLYLEQNTTGGPSFSLGYRVEGTAATRVFLGPGNNKPLDFRTSGAQQAMTILNDGKVGIGNPSPAAALHVRRNEGVTSGERTWASFDRNGANNSTDPSFGWGYRADGANPSRVFIGTGNNFPLDFRTSSVPQAMTILNDGKVGIGNPSPAAKLEVDVGTDETMTGSWGNGIKVKASRYPTIRFHSASSNKTSFIGNDNNGSLHFGVNGTGDNFAGYGYLLSLMPTGNVGIGTTSPQTRLDVNGGLNTAGRITVNSASDQLQLQEHTLTDKQWRMGTNIGSNPGDPRHFQIWETDQRNVFTIRYDNGAVGIGTTTPQSRLHVAGNATVDGGLTVASITTRTWTVAPDYVFEKDYKLRSLEEVDAFVKKNKHLPEVPSAKEFKHKGMDLAQMNFTLLKKVEELTLHMIRQEKELRRQKEENRRQSDEIRNLRSAR